jgi:hypothetical protein
MPSLPNPMTPTLIFLFFSNAVLIQPPWPESQNDNGRRKRRTMINEQPAEFKHPWPGLQ